MKNLFLSVTAAIAIFVLYNTFSYGSIQDDPKTMADCPCSTCEMKSDCDGNCTGSGCDKIMGEFKKEPMKMKMSSGESNLSNETCPVSGEAIGDSKVTFTYLGKEYKFCCEGCVKEFKTEPMDYVKDLKCPVQGDEANKKVSAVYEGTKYYFCCAGCDKEFLSNPGKYMNGNSN